MNNNNSIFTLQFALLCLSGFLFFGSFNMIIPELPSYLDSLGGGEYKGLIIALFTVTAGLSRPFSGKLTDKVGRIPVMVVGALVSGIAALIYPFVTGIIGFFALRFFHGFSTGFKPTGTSAYVADIVPAARRGEAMGIVGFFSSLGMAAGPAIGSFIASNAGLNAMFYSSSAFAILSVLILIGMKESLKDREKLSASHFYVKPNEVFEPNVISPSLTVSHLPFGQAKCSGWRVNRAVVNQRWRTRLCDCCVRPPSLRAVTSTSGGKMCSIWICVDCRRFAGRMCRWCSRVRSTRLTLY